MSLKMALSRSFGAAALAMLLAAAGGGPATDDTVVARLQAEAAALSPLVESDLARRFLAATEGLSAPPVRIVYLDEANRKYYSERAAAGQPDGGVNLVRRVLSPEQYYYTKYGTPLAYARALDLVAGAGLAHAGGARIADYGFGTVGHLRLLARLGAEVVGVDVDTWLSALYSELEDQGAVRNPSGSDGRVTLAFGRWPSDAAVRATVGGGFDLFISKNTLKRGYIHPARETDPRLLIDLGVDDATFVKAVYDSLAPRGIFMIYNLSPKQSPPDQPYIPWADGECPFERALLESTGFEIIAFDIDDSEAIREMASALGWADADMDIENNLFAHYTIARKTRSQTLGQTPPPGH